VGRIVNFVLIGAMIMVAIVTYDMKRRAESAAEQVAALRAAIALEKDRITELRAEWSLLTQPGRLQAVIEQHADFFQLEPFSPSQIATIGEIPLKPIGGGDDEKARELLARMAAGATGDLD
jgi:hypothetical protein